ncbi:MAG TPA: hypothetical protein VFW60_10460 [Rhodanobacteraceae bacterium]|nr:hypothetical protein [Rhodanobacteraceae bacterium]
MINFQAVCLRSDELCSYIELKFSNDGIVDEYTVTFLPLPNEAAVKFWNGRVIGHSSNGAKKVKVEVSVYDSSRHDWMRLETNEHCPLCAPGGVHFDGKAKRWLRFEVDRASRWRLKHSTWAFVRTVSRNGHVRYFVIVDSHHGPTVCGSLRDSGMHSRYSTKATGTFQVLLDSSWVPSNRPDYVAISPVCSWNEVARRYMRSQTHALSGSSRLPVFTGTVEQKIDAAVKYIKFSGIHYDAKPDKGGYPNQDVAAILATGKTDCKGFVTLLYALLRRSGVASDPVLFNGYGMTPLSFGVPDNWSDHVMLYVPAIKRYVDLTVSLPSHGEYTWETSAGPYAGDVVLDLATGQFEVVPETRATVPARG